MTGTEIIAMLKARFGETVQATEESASALLDSVFVDKAALSDVCRFLKDDEGLRFEFLTSITGTDVQSAGEIHIAYLVTSLKLKQRFAVKVKVGRDNPSVGTVGLIWPAADWLEREIFDLLGVEFTGHPDLRRLLMPDDWPGHPLRKDYKEQPEYHGMPTTRKSWLEE